MPVVIRLAGPAGAEHEYPEPVFVMQDCSDGSATPTQRIERAKRYATRADAMEAWRLPSTTYPVRPDGQPNRPLTAFNIELIEVPS